MLLAEDLEGLTGGKVALEISPRKLLDTIKKHIFKKCQSLGLKIALPV